MFIPDIIIINSRAEVRQEERTQDRESAEKRRKLEELRKLKEDGVITEEEFNQRLMDIL